MQAVMSGPQTCPSIPPIANASYSDFAKSEYDALVIGGIDGQVWGPDITACITYRLPHTVQGMPATITIGLADECITNTLVGIPFMTRARLIYMTWQNRWFTREYLGLRGGSQWSNRQNPTAHQHGQEDQMGQRC